ncbi:Tim17-domain-containing protein [Trametes cingulata]|nr:Tim17-domain-containing protein [Trametes cingulata]
MSLVFVGDHVTSSLMWLLDTEDGTFHHIDRPREERYAILSHVWQLTGEQSFQDLIALQLECRKRRSRFGFKWGFSIFAPTTSHCALIKASAKIRDCCALARRHGYRRVWIDSCCIDKTSSTELSEAINSMYEWYAAADVCFAFLEDVSDDHDPRLKDSKFRRSRWFTRGWTLQELIAPTVVMFLSKEWRLLGTKASLADLIEEITGIDRTILTHEKSIDRASVARRMSWASKRQTTREEDKAYSLMGIFGVNMPTIYGEGGNAFIRLQEEILKQVPDQSIFAWGPALRDDTMLYRNVDPNSITEDARYWQSRNLFAWSPDAFVNAGRVSSTSPESFQKQTGISFVLPTYAITSYGMRARLPLVPIQHSSAKTTYLALLACEDAEANLIALLLYPRPESTDRFFVGHYIGRPQVPPNSYYRIVSVSQSRLAELAKSAQTREVCIPYRPSPTAQRVPLVVPSMPSFRCPCDVVVPTWTIADIAKAGFITSVRGNNGVIHVMELTAPQNPALVLVSRHGTIHIRMGRCQCRGRFLSVSVTGTKSTSSKSSPPSLTETISASRSRCPKNDIPGGVTARCPSDHVASWTNACKDMTYETMRIRLSFSAWVDRADVYSLSIIISTLEAAQVEGQTLVNVRHDKMASTSDRTPSSFVKDDPAIDAPASSHDLLLGAFDPAKLHPMAGIEDKLDYLLLDDEKTTDLPGAGTPIPSRGWSDDLCYGTGTMYLSGLALGGVWGLREGARKPLAVSNARLRINSILNSVTRRGTFIGNSAGCLALVYNAFNSTIDHFRGKHDTYGSMAAGALTGALYKSTAGVKPALAAATVISGSAGIWSYVKRRV